MTDEQLTLPGLQVNPDRPDTAMVSAARVTLLALRESRQLGPKDALLAQLVLTLAAAIDKGTGSGRASAVAMASKELREALLMLDPPPEDSDAARDAAAKLAEFVRDLEAHANNGSGQ
jgi:hypothetical protein